MRYENFDCSTKSPIADELFVLLEATWVTYQVGKIQSSAFEVTFLFP